MTPSYSDDLPSFKKDQPDEEEELRGHERLQKEAGENRAHCCGWGGCW
jgi:hypothetical protein